MIKYDTYKDSGIEWLGEIPEHWEVNRLKNVFSFCTGLSITKKNLQDKGIPCVNYGEIHSKYGFEVDPNIHPLKCVEKSYLTTKKKALLRKGDFIFSDTSEDIEGSGNFTYLNSDIQTFAGYHTIVAKLQQKGNYRFIAYLLDSIDFRTQIQSNVAGIKVYSITQGLLKRLNIFFPPIKEQTQIANYLDRKTKAIDKKINLLTQKTAKYKELRKAIINQTVTKGLDKNVKLKDSGIEWIGEIPVHWDVKRFKDVANIINGYAFNSKKYLDNGFPIVRIGDIKDEIDFNKTRKVSKENAKLAKDSKIVINDILMAMTGATIGKNSFYTSKTIAYLNQRVCSFRIKNNIPLFVRYFINSTIFQAYITLVCGGSAQENISKTQLDIFPIPIPPLPEQTTIANYLDEKTNKIDAIVNNITNQINALKELRKTLINDVVTGKIKVV